MLFSFPFTSLHARAVACNYSVTGVEIKEAQLLIRDVVSLVHY
jgi:hypothetical protein